MQQHVTARWRGAVDPLHQYSFNAYSTIAHSTLKLSFAFMPFHQTLYGLDIYVCQLSCATSTLTRETR